MSFVPFFPESEVVEGKCLVKKTRFGSVVLTKWEGQVYAFEDVCSHDGEEISCGELEGPIIRCPRHFAEFDIRTGAVIRLPATEPIAVYPIQIKNGIVEVNLEAE